MLGLGIPRISRLESLDISGDAKKFVSRDMRTKRDDVKSEERGRKRVSRTLLKITTDGIHIVILPMLIEESITKFNY